MSRALSAGCQQHLIIPVQIEPAENTADLLFAVYRQHAEMIPFMIGSLFRQSDFDMPCAPAFRRLKFPVFRNGCVNRFIRLCQRRPAKPADKLKTQRTSLFSAFSFSLRPNAFMASVHMLFPFIKLSFKIAADVPSPREEKRSAPFRQASHQ